MDAGHFQTTERRLFGLETRRASPLRPDVRRPARIRAMVRDRDDPSFLQAKERLLDSQCRSGVACHKSAEGAEDDPRQRITTLSFDLRLSLPYKGTASSSSSTRVV
jgi:hypothetical protein